MSHKFVEILCENCAGLGMSSMNGIPSCFECLLNVIFLENERIAAVTTPLPVLSAEECGNAPFQSA